MFGAVGAEEIASFMRAIDERGACGQILRPREANGWVGIARLRGKLRDRDRNTGHRAIAFRRVIEKSGNKFLPPVHDGEILRAHEVVLRELRTALRRRTGEAAHLVAIARAPISTAHAQRLTVANGNAPPRDYRVATRERTACDKLGAEREHRQMDVLLRAELRKCVGTA